MYIFAITGFWIPVYHGSVSISLLWISNCGLGKPLLFRRRGQLVKHCGSNTYSPRKNAAISSAYGLPPSLS